MYICFVMFILAYAPSYSTYIPWTSPSIFVSRSNVLLGYLLFNSILPSFYLVSHISSSLTSIISSSSTRKTRKQPWKPLQPAPPPYITSQPRDIIARLYYPTSLYSLTSPIIPIASKTSTMLSSTIQHHQLSPAPQIKRTVSQRYETR